MGLFACLIGDFFGKVRFLCFGRYEMFFEILYVLDFCTTIFRLLAAIHVTNIGDFLALKVPSEGE